MQALHATEANPNGCNEDLARVGRDWAFVLDGAGRYPGHDGGCVHPVTWVVQRLAVHLAEQLDQLGQAAAGRHGLAGPLRAAIEATMADHGPACDLSDPLSPGAAAAIVRCRPAANLIEYLVLADCAVTFEQRNGETLTVLDDRVDRLPDAPVADDAPVRTYQPAYVRTVRNRPGGFWIAGAVPEAADQAYRGQIVMSGVGRVLLCTDGVTRLTERYGWSWPAVFELADASGPAALVRAVRVEEKTDPEPRRWRGKEHDDATAVYVPTVA